MPQIPYSGPQYTCSGCRGTKAHTLSQALLFLPQAHPRTHASLHHQSIFQVLPHHFLYRIAHTAFPLTALMRSSNSCTRSFISFICRELYVLHTNTPPGFTKKKSTFGFHCTRHPDCHNRTVHGLLSRSHTMHPAYTACGHPSPHM